MSLTYDLISKQFRVPAYDFEDKSKILVHDLAFSPHLQLIDL